MFLQTVAHEPAEEAEGWREAEHVAHAGAVVHGREVVLVLEAGEVAVRHDVAEVIVGAHDVDEAGVLEAQAEVAA